MRKRKRLLSVDFDFFFPEMSLDPKLWQYYDWGHRESRFFLDAIWYARAQSFLMNGLSLPTTSGEEVGFWDRFRFQHWTRLYLSDSHVSMYTPRVMKGVTEVVNYDAHHDAGYKGTFEDWLGRGKVTCEDWVLAYSLAKVPVTTIYPRWKTWAIDEEPTPLVPMERRFDDGLADPEPFDRGFVCRSGAWTPSWLDPNFQTFLDAFPKRYIHNLGMHPRGFSLDSLREILQTHLQSMRDTPSSDEQFREIEEKQRASLELALQTIGCH